MVKKNEIPLLILMAFTLIYATIGNPDSELWSGMYFVVNYTTMLWLFKGHNSKLIQGIGISLSVSILVFIALRYFFHAEIERYYTIVPFIICLIGIFKLHKRKWVK